MVLFSCIEVLITQYQELSNITHLRAKKIPESQNTEKLYSPLHSVTVYLTFTRELS